MIDARTVLGWNTFYAPPLLMSQLWPVNDPLFPPYGWLKQLQSELGYAI